MEIFEGWGFNFGGEGINKRQAFIPVSWLRVLPVHERGRRRDLSKAGSMSVCPNSRACTGWDFSMCGGYRSTCKDYDVRFSNGGPAKTKLAPCKLSS